MKRKIQAALLLCCLLLTSCGVLPTGNAGGTEPVTGSDPATDPGTEPGTAPATDPGTEPETVPETEPVTEPETAPVTEPETAAPVTVRPTPVPGLRTLKNFLVTGLSPIGSVMYVFGGGWNEADDGAGDEARSIGLSDAWAAFAAAQDASYDHDAHRYEIHNGLDCSGFVGWTVYNTLHAENGLEGYVVGSTGMAKHFADLGLGSFVGAGEPRTLCPGDVVSMKGHVWISLGTCADGSAVILHCSPNGVILCGTVGEQGESDASRLAGTYMSTYYPEWYAKYPAVTRSAGTYLSPETTVFRFSSSVLSDAEGVGRMSAEELLPYLFGETERP